MQKTTKVKASAIVQNNKRCTTEYLTKAFGKLEGGQTTVSSSPSTFGPKLLITSISNSSWPTTTSLSNGYPTLTMASKS